MMSATRHHHDSGSSSHQDTTSCRYRDVLYEFVVELRSSDICPICLDVLDNPVTIKECQHDFCKDCIDEWFEKEPRCPIDNLTIDPNLAIPDQRQERAIRCLLVYCGNRDKGCTATPELADYDAHFSSCRVVTCPHSCGRQLVQSVVDEHKRDGCHVEHGQHKDTEDEVGVGKAVNLTAERAEETRQERLKHPFTNMYIRNLAVELTDEILDTMFSHDYHVMNVRIMRDKHGKSLRYGFVSFKYPTDALKAVNFIHGKELFGRKIWAGPWQPSEERKEELRLQHRDVPTPPPSAATANNLYVKHLDTAIEDEGLRRMFAKFGSIISAKVMCHDTGRSKGFGFVCFSTAQEAANALEEMHERKYSVNHRPLYVAIAKKKEDRQTMLSEEHMEKIQCSHYGPQRAVRSQSSPSSNSQVHQRSAPIIRPQPHFVHPSLRPVIVYPSYIRPFFQPYATPPTLPLHQPGYGMPDQSRQSMPNQPKSSPLHQPKPRLPNQPRPSMPNQPKSNTQNQPRSTAPSPMPAQPLPLNHPSLRPPMMPETNNTIVDLFRKLLTSVTIRPSIMDDTALMTDYLRSISANITMESTLNDIIDIIIAQGVAEQGFQCAGARMCVILIKLMDDPIVGSNLALFRKRLLNRLQEGFQRIDSVDHIWTCGFLLFVTELFLHFRTNKGDPFMVLRQAIYDAITKILVIGTANDAIVSSVCLLLKLAECAIKDTAKEQPQANFDNVYRTLISLTTLANRRTLNRNTRILIESVLCNDRGGSPQTDPRTDPQHVVHDHSAIYKEMLNSTRTSADPPTLDDIQPMSSESHPNISLAQAATSLPISTEHLTEPIPNLHNSILPNSTGSVDCLESLDETCEKWLQLQNVDISNTNDASDSSETYVKELATAISDENLSESMTTSVKTIDTQDLECPAEVVNTDAKLNAATESTLDKKVVSINHENLKPSKSGVPQPSLIEYLNMQGFSLNVVSKDESELSPRKLVTTDESMNSTLETDGKRISPQNPQNGINTHTSKTSTVVTPVSSAKSNSNASSKNNGRSKNAQSPLNRQSSATNTSVNNFDKKPPVTNSKSTEKYPSNKKEIPKLMNLAIYTPTSKNKSNGYAESLHVKNQKSRTRARSESARQSVSSKPTTKREMTPGPHTKERSRLSVAERLDQYNGGSDGYKQSRGKSTTRTKKISLVTESGDVSGSPTQNPMPASSSQQKSKPMSQDKVRENLNRLLQRAASYDSITRWIEDQVDEKTCKSLVFVRTLMTCVCKSVIMSSVDNTRHTLDESHFTTHRRGALLIKYLVTSEQQLNAIYALQATLNRLGFPSGLLQEFFQLLYHKEVISKASFNKWYVSKDPAEFAAKKLAEKQVRQFFDILSEDR